MLLKLDPTRFNRTQTVVAIDPGLHIGVASAHLTPYDASGVWEVTFSTVELKWLGKLDLDSLAISLPATDVVILEGWDDRGECLANWQSALECIGWVKGVMAQQCAPTKLVVQAASVQAHYKPFARAKFKDQWPKSDHAQSALTHLIAYLIGGK